MNHVPKIGMPCRLLLLHIFNRPSFTKYCRLLIIICFVLSNTKSCFHSKIVALKIEDNKLKVIADIYVKVIRSFLLLQDGLFCGAMLQIAGDNTCDGDEYNCLLR